MKHLWKTEVQLKFLKPTIIRGNVGKMLHLVKQVWNCLINDVTCLWALQIKTRSFIKSFRTWRDRCWSIIFFFTSWKLCWVNLSAMRSSSRQECVSAKALIPKQLEGSSCLFRNSQQASWISASWRRQAAGSNVWTFPSSTVTWGWRRHSCP